MGLVLVDKILLNKVKGKLNKTVLLDLSKYFNTVPKNLSWSLMIWFMQCESHSPNNAKCCRSCMGFFSVASKALYFFLFVIDRPSVIKHSWASSLCWWHGTSFLLLEPNWHREHINYENSLAIANWMLICSDFWLAELLSITDWFMFWTMMINVLEFSNI